MAYFLFKSLPGFTRSIVNDRFYALERRLASFEGGGGSGLTPNLQQVTDEGVSTTNSIVVTDGLTNEIFLDQSNGRMQLKSADDTTYYSPTQILFENNTNNSSVTISRGTRDGAVLDFFEFPNKSGVPDTIAMMSDIISSIGSLQQVTEIGATTDRSISIEDLGADTQVFIDAGAAVINARNGTNNLQLQSTEINLQNLFNASSVRLRSVNRANNIDDIYYLPDKSGVADTIAMITDVPFSGPYAAAITNPVNCSAIRVFTRYQRIPLIAGFETTNVYFSFTVTSIAAGFCSFEVQIPQSIPALTVLLMAGQGAAKTAANNIVPVFISNIGTNKALIQYTAAAGTEIRTLNGIFSYGYA
jgi:hypothetical protein